MLAIHALVIGGPDVAVLPAPFVFEIIVIWSELSANVLQETELLENDAPVTVVGDSLIMRPLQIERIRDHLPGTNAMAVATQGKEA